MVASPSGQAVVVLEGRGLHTGASAKVRLRRTESERVELVVGERVVGLGELVLVGADRSTVVASRDGAVRVATVEHLLSALAGLGVRSALAIEVEGPEIPLLDGGARAFTDALAKLEVAWSAPSLVVARGGAVEVGSSRYEFDVASEVRISVELELDGLEPRASWDGDPEDFRDRIAPARTFGFEHEVLALVERGLASHVAPESVVVLGRGGAVLSAGPPFRSDEPARHKLLDLLGDLALHGGPPRGVIAAFRPGHAASHEAVRRALDLGILARM